MLVKPSTTRPVRLEFASDKATARSPHRRHQRDDDDAVGDGPGEHRQISRQSKPASMPRVPATIDDEVPDAVDHVHDAFADRHAGLHDLLADAAGIVVLEEAEALPEHVAVALPAHQRRQVRHDRQVDQPARQDREDRPARRAARTLMKASSQKLSATKRSRARRRHPVDERAEEAEHGKLGHRGDERDDKRGDDQPLHRLDEVAEEFRELGGRLLDRRGAERVDPVLQPAIRQKAPQELQGFSFTTRRAIIFTVGDRQSNGDSGNVATAAAMTTSREQN